MCGNCKHFKSRTLISSGTEIKYLGICDKVPEDDPERFVYSNTEVSSCHEYHKSIISEEVKELEEFRLILKKSCDKIFPNEKMSEIAYDTIANDLEPVVFNIIFKGLMER